MTTGDSSRYGKPRHRAWAVSSCSRAGLQGAAPGAGPWVPWWASEDTVLGRPGRSPGCLVVLRLGTPRLCVGLASLRPQHRQRQARHQAQGSCCVRPGHPAPPLTRFFQESWFKRLGDESQLPTRGTKPAAHTGCLPSAESSGLTDPQSWRVCLRPRALTSSLLAEWNQGPCLGGVSRSVWRACP